jgi:hypothetical protein
VGPGVMFDLTFCSLANRIGIVRHQHPS